MCNPFKLIRDFFYPNRAILFGATDLPDERDDQDEKPVPKGKLPKKVDLLYRAEQVANDLGVDLVLKMQSRNSCTAYALTWMRILQELLENGRLIDIDGEVQWEWQLSTGGSRDHGDRLQNALNQARKHPQGFPFDRYKALDRYDIHHAKVRLAQENFVYLGVHWGALESGESNYYKALRTGLWEKVFGRANGGHACFAFGYDDDAGELLIAEPMKKFWGGWRMSVFHVKYEDYPALMSKYIIQTFDERASQPS